MRIDAMQRVLKMRPFKPLIIRVADGREYSVEHSEGICWSRDCTSTLVVSIPDGGDVLIDPLLISSIHVSNVAK